MPGLDLEFHRGRVAEKGGGTAYVHGETPTARLLPRLLQGRVIGPVFLADRRAPASGRRAPALADIDPATGRGRLSYPRAERLFKTASALHDPHGSGYTLHQLRRSGLKHLAEKGRSAPDLRPRHRRERRTQPPTSTLRNTGIGSGQRMGVASSGTMSR
ncbi:hypothetical protein [Streptomyces sp. NPDC059816]|uniref:hypothetical protein n=1 Tax=Streptomyces sp. NPDC059816 TaxID=3346960 RepID=UPI003659F7CB